MLKTYKDLLEAIQELTPEQLKMTVTVSSGCDENGNAEFFTVNMFTMAMNSDLESAATDLFEPTQPIILFEQ